MKNLSAYASILFISLISASTVRATPVAITSYSCRIALFAADLPSGSAEITISRPLLAGGSHGGDPYEFSAGEHQVSIVADAKWRGIMWTRSGKTVAHVMLAGAHAITGNQVILLSNPMNPEEMVQLACDPLPGDFPKE